MLCIKVNTFLLLFILTSFSFNSKNMFLSCSLFYFAHSLTIGVRKMFAILFFWFFVFGVGFVVFEVDSQDLLTCLKQQQTDKKRIQHINRNKKLVESQYI